MATILFVACQQEELVEPTPLIENITLVCDNHIEGQKYLAGYNMTFNTFLNNHYDVRDWEKKWVIDGVEYADTNYSITHAFAAAGNHTIQYVVSNGSRSYSKQLQIRIVYQGTLAFWTKNPNTGPITVTVDGRSRVINGYYESTDSFPGCNVQQGVVRFYNVPYETEIVYKARASNYGYGVLQNAIIIDESASGACIPVLLY